MACTPKKMQNMQCQCIFYYPSTSSKGKHRTRPSQVKKIERKSGEEDKREGENNEKKRKHVLNFSID